MCETDAGDGGDKGEKVYRPESLVVGIARVGAKDQKMAAGTLREMSNVELGGPLHSLVLLGKRTHDLERDFIRAYAINTAEFDRAWREHHDEMQ